jgi:bifunctional DNA-binding transcriptional regulator/antitoxin component of YhaV-PrlF toxin-antitoxin module
MEITKLSNQGQITIPQILKEIQEDIDWLESNLSSLEKYEPFKIIAETGKVKIGI